MSPSPEDWLKPETLTGRFIRLEPLTADHAPGILAAADDDEIFRWMSWPRPIDEQAARALVDFYAALPMAIAWAQVDRSTGTVIGATACYEIDPVNRSLAIGYTWLTTRAHRTAANTEAKLLLTARAFEDLGAVRVTWYTDGENRRAQAAIERLGTQHEGVLRRHKRRRDGTWRDTVVYSLLADEWPATKSGLTARLER